MLKRVMIAALCLVSVAAVAQKGKPPASGGGNSSPVGTLGGGRTPVTNSGPYIPYGTPNNNGTLYNPTTGSYTVYDPLSGALRPMTPQEERLHRAMLKQRNIDRQKSMISDSQKLVALANSLQQDVDRGSASSDSEKKAGQIEKLAKNVKNKMTGEN
ncbi:MAG: hypothetical protein JOZ43_07880 [Acidobacteriales bacterium]|nr:hypothetical protein [Terriglobales bacterium]